MVLAKVLAGTAEVDADMADAAQLGVFLRPDFKLCLFGCTVGCAVFLRVITSFQFL